MSRIAQLNAQISGEIEKHEFSICSGRYFDAGFFADGCAVPGAQVCAVYADGPASQLEPRVSAWIYLVGDSLTCIKQRNVNPRVLVDVNRTVFAGRSRD